MRGSTVAGYVIYYEPFRDVAPCAQTCSDADAPRQVTVPGNVCGLTVSLGRPTRS